MSKLSVGLYKPMRHLNWGDIRCRFFLVCKQTKSSCLPVCPPYTQTVLQKNRQPCWVEFFLVEILRNFYEKAWKSEAAENVGHNFLFYKGEYLTSSTLSVSNFFPQSPGQLCRILVCLHTKIFKTKKKSAASRQFRWLLRGINFVKGAFTWA